MSVRFKTGNKATLVLSGTLTTGVTTAWVGDIVSINPGSWELGERDVTVLADEGFMRFDPADLVTPNEISGTIYFRPSLGVPSFGGVSTATITFPQVSTATTGITRATLAGKAFFKTFQFPTMENNETMSAEFALRMTGETLAYTKENP
jgi:hypothetical protein